MSHVFTRSDEKPHLCHIVGFRFSFEKSERSENQKHFLINESYLHIISQLQHLYLGFKRNIIFVYSFNYNIQKWLLPPCKMFMSMNLCFTCAIVVAMYISLCMPHVIKMAVPTSTFIGD